ncbi:MAG: F0F1 ATP synthase subunit epsilon [Candidatus Sulfobium sp.]
MTGSSFRLRIVTPEVVTEKDVHHIRMKDATGFFGVMKGHEDFLTVLEPSLCYYTDTAGKEFFLAVDGGLLCIRDGVVSLTSRDVYESSDADRLAATIERTLMRRDESENTLRGMLEGIERAFLERSVAFIKGKTP